MVLDSGGVIERPFLISTRSCSSSYACNFTAKSNLYSACNIGIRHGFSARVLRVLCPAVSYNRSTVATLCCNTKLGNVNSTNAIGRCNDHMVTCF